VCLINLVNNLFFNLEVDGSAQRHHGSSVGRLRHESTNVTGGGLGVVGLVCPEPPEADNQDIGEWKE
jgi:hypothetical protein